LNFLGWIYETQLEKVLRHIKFIREMLKDQLHLCKNSKFFAKNF
jgi:archaellum component FlaD/FlaE